MSRRNRGWVSLVSVFVFAFAACGGSNESTPAGPVGAPTDLRSRITNPERFGDISVRIDARGDARIY